MNALRVETFLSFETDMEMNQYYVLGGIKKYLSEFNKNKLYPALAELVDLAVLLQEVLKQKNNLSYSFPKQIAEYDLKNKKIIFDTVENLSPEIEFLFDLIEWSLPKIKNAIEEGIALYEYVEKN